RGGVMSKDAERPVTVSDLLEAIDWAIAVLRWNPGSQFTLDGPLPGLSPYSFARNIVNRLWKDLAKRQLLDEPALFPRVNHGSWSSASQLLRSLIERGVIGPGAAAGAEGSSADDDQ